MTAKLLNARTFHANFLMMTDLVAGAKLTSESAAKFMNSVCSTALHETPGPHFNKSVKASMRWNPHYVQEVREWAGSSEAAKLFSPPPPPAAKAAKPVPVPVPVFSPLPHPAANAAPVPFVLTWLKQALRRMDEGAKPADAFQFDGCRADGQRVSNRPRLAWNKVDDGARLAYLYAVEARHGWAVATSMLAESNLFNSARGVDDREMKRCLALAKRAGQVNGTWIHGVESGCGFASEALAINRKYQE